MNKSYLSLSACALLATFTFVGCGSSSNTTTSTGTLQLNPALGNITYDCGDGEKTTDENGKYSYIAGSECEFTFGGVKLKANPSANLTIESILEDTTKNPNVSQGAIWGYISAATGLSQAELSSAGKVSLSDAFKSATDDISDFTSFDSLSEDLEASSGFAALTDSNGKFLKDKFASNKAKISSAKTAKRVDVRFEEIETPVSSDDKLTQQASSKVMINDEEQAISYKTIFRTGLEGNGEVLGQSKDYQDKLITFEDGSPYICNGSKGAENREEGSGMDFTSLHNVDGKIFAISQYECALGSMYMMELEQKGDGELIAKKDTLQYISQKDEFGGFVHCAGQTTPWSSHLSSEEYEPDAKDTSKNSYHLELKKYWGENDYSAYYYGWTPEVKIENEKPVYSKHYAMGRFSHELSYVMPDNKTVYMSDDGTNVGLFMYVSDTAKDLSAGTLYAAKWNQTSEVGIGLGEADIQWISLGHATNEQIRAIIDPDGDITTNDAPTFADIFDISEGTDGSCTQGYVSINTSAGHECLKIKEGMELAASRLETRRYAAYMGATTEFRKEEGITFDKNSGKLYVAMSEVSKGMAADSSNDLGGNDDIKVEANKCGGIYALDVSTNSVKDTNESVIPSKYVVENMYGILSGNPISYAEGTTYAGNSCDVNGIANPDNVTFLPNSDVLIIGEDAGSSVHQNNVVWSYNVKTEELSRIFTTPLSAETTSPFWYPELANGFGYLSVVTQHPSFDSTDEGESAFGYVGPFKNLTSLENVKSIDSVTKIATLDTKVEGGSEIVAFDKDSKKMFTTNGKNNTLDITPINEDGTIGSTTAIDLSAYGAGVQSVAVSNGKVAVAVGSDDKVNTKGKVVIFDTAGVLVSQTTVGYLPDMVTFSEDGNKVIVANEGEPDASSGTYVDVAGTIGIVTVANTDKDDNANGYAEVGFENATLSDALDGTPVRLGGTPSNDKALDLEPEYITVSGTYAYVTLQENNAVAKIDISTSTPVVIAVKSLGAKDYSSENLIDIEEEGYALFKNYPGLKGLYMPDSISSYKVDGKTYLVTANEGDGREYLDSADEDVFVDEKKISKLDLDSSIAAAYEDENDLKVVTDMGDSNNDGLYEELYTYGARSFTIWDDEANLVWDSGDALSKLTSKMMPNLFNQDEGEIDGRSGNKGVEPEALTVGKIGTQTYAFVGLERQNAIVVYDITTPENAKFVKFINTEAQGDISPEGMSFVDAENSPTGNALLLVAFEVSGTTAVYEIK
ncbi:hypothetical protein GCM10012288_19890 [Malaciobacter pacificus]|uniref:DUF839 domain-containing protein n=1 Tax=Malaciobacter pacificus TaxID=1080223 RepID=A0A5C2H5E4_9BACT|nr:choice-of-anchor I family protein [Malaciobacter pacificus]QEP33599.1 DUF839 domain-containing protein [Malaciobacter pacificus]GGD45576.1 hypothetical protein GCM10012288_19890 [Malaciobacter pacificus]